MASHHKQTMRYHPSEPPSSSFTRILLFLIVVVLPILCESWTLPCRCHDSSRQRQQRLVGQCTAPWSSSATNGGRLFAPLLALNGGNNPDNEALEDDTGLSFQIRPCQYNDLNAVSDIIMDSFYDTKVSWRRLVKLAELNRLQQNFPYVDLDLHQMFVAVTLPILEAADDNNNNKQMVVVGFVDVDARPCKPEIKLPRPYLSDLAIHPDYRRRGIAKALVQTGEAFIQAIPRAELYIRVEETNHAAIAMYHQLNYQSQSVEEVPREKKRVLTLHKYFVDGVGDDEKDDGTPKEVMTLPKDQGLTGTAMDYEASDADQASNEQQKGPVDFAI